MVTDFLSSSWRSIYLRTAVQYVDDCEWGEACPWQLEAAVARPYQSGRGISMETRGNSVQQPVV
jgi:hypothetical protein